MPSGFQYSAETSRQYALVVLAYPVSKYTVVVLFKPCKHQEIFKSQSLHHQEVIRRHLPSSLGDLSLQKQH